MSDLIGTKRPSRVRSVRTWVTISILIAVSLMVAYLLYRRVASYAHPTGSAPAAPLEVDGTAPEDGLRYGIARLRYLGALGILRTEGSLHDIGAQHGRLLASEIQSNQQVFQDNVEQTVSAEGFLNNKMHNIRLRWGWRTLDDGIPGHQLAEIAGVVRGASKSDVHMDYEDLVRQSGLLDVGEPAAGSSGAELWTIARAFTLLVPISSPVEQRLIVGRSLGLPGASDDGSSARERPLLHIEHPKDALAHASLAWPGMVGVLSGVNSQSIGVFLHFTKTSEVRLTREAQPSTLIAKAILENAHSLDEAIAVLKKATCLGSAVFVVVDGNERSWAAIERSPSTIQIRRGTGAAAIVDNLEGTKFKDDAINNRSQRTRPMLQRQKRAQQLLKKSHTSTAEVVAMLRDRKSAEGSTLVLGHRAAIDDVASVHSALFDVSGLVLWVSETGDASGAYRAIDLRHEFSAGSRPAPPPDIPAAGEDQGARAAARAARRLTVQARRAQARGELGRARELAAAALARSPTLPEALLTAGQMARADNDELSARALLQRFLELGPDDLRAQEQIEAWLGAN